MRSITRLCEIVFPSLERLVGVGLSAATEQGWPAVADIPVIAPTSDAVVDLDPLIDGLDSEIGAHMCHKSWQFTPAWDKR